jgi:BirA family biotin operon repressor/biotin-[acetyl-CoA-carboxylase] ligase
LTGNFLLNLIYFKTLDSTNKYSKKNLELLNNFDVIYTDNQTNGYGQWDRKWIDTGDKNIYMSIILKPKNINLDIVRYTAVCICNVLKKYGVEPKIKEPNDILVSNKKIAGILAESITKGDVIKGVVVGIGINLNTDAEILSMINQPATSLNLEINRYIDKISFISDIMIEFEGNYVKFEEKKFNLNSFL